MATTLTTDTLTTPPALTQPTPTPDPIIASHNGMISDAIANLPQQQATVDQNTANTQANLNQQGELQNFLMGKTADTAAQDTANGVDDLTKEIADYNSQLQNTQANLSSVQDAANVIPLAIQKQFQGTATDLNGVNNNASGPLRDNAINAYTQSAIANQLAAKISGDTNKLTVAQGLTTKAINAKYSGAEAQLANLQSQLTQNKEFITDPAEKKLADQQQLVINEANSRLADQKATDQKNSDLILNAQAQGASPTLIAAAKKVADQGGSNLAVGSALGPYAGDYLGTQLKKAQIVEANASAAKTRADTATAAAASDPSNLAQQLVSGNLAPSELSKRSTGTAAYNAVLQAADAYSMKTTGKHFDIAQADRNYKYATNTSTQNTLNYMGSLIGSTDANGNVTGGNLDALKTLSDSLPRTDFPAVNSAKWNAMIQTGDPATVAYMTNVTEVADQIAKVLQGGGGGGTSDAKLSQATQIFNKNFSVAQIDAVVNTLKPLLLNRAQGIIGNNPYLSDYADQFGFDNPGQVGGVANNPYTAVLNPSSAKPSASQPIYNDNSGTYAIPNN